MTKETAITFLCKRFCFGLEMDITRNKLLVRFPMICHHLLYFFVFDLVPLPPSSLGATVAKYTVDKFFSTSVNSSPYPTVVF